MSANQDISRVVRSWIREEDGDSADRVLEIVLSRLDSTPQRRPFWPARRTSSMARRLTLLAAAAVIGLGAILLGGRLLAPAPPNVGASPTVAATASPPPAPTATPVPLGELPAGPRSIAAGGPLVTLDFPAGWSEWGISTPQGTAFFNVSPNSPNLGVVVGAVANVYADPCQPADGLLDPPLGPTAEDLAAALAGQPNTTIVSPPADSTIDGFTGRHLEYANADEDPSCSLIRRYSTAFLDREAIIGEHDEVWILDVAGDRVIIDLFWFDLTDPDRVDAARSLIEGATIEPAS